MINMLNRLEEVRKDESGFTTAELLGNAALGIVALAAIWLALGALGEDVVDLIRDKLGL